jgi:hypothetical protein
MTADANAKTLIPKALLRRLLKEKAYAKDIARKDAERRRARTQRLIKELLESTPESRLDAASARAAAVFTQVEQIAAQADLQAAETGTETSLKEASPT